MLEPLIGEFPDGPSDVGGPGAALLFVRSLELLLLWPLATFVATFAMRSR